MPLRARRHPLGAPSASSPGRQGDAKARQVGEGTSSLRERARAGKMHPHSRQAFGDIDIRTCARGRAGIKRRRPYRLANPVSRFGCTNGGCACHKKGDTEEYWTYPSGEVLPWECLRMKPISKIARSIIKLPLAPLRMGRQERPASVDLSGQRSGNRLNLQKASREEARARKLEELTQRLVDDKLAWIEATLEVVPLRSKMR